MASDVAAEWMARPETVFIIFQPCCVVQEEEAYVNDHIILAHLQISKHSALRL